MNRYQNINELKSIKPGTKILFANFPADGHFNPLTGLAVHLKNLGCDVRWYTSVKYREKIMRLDIPFYPLQRALDVSGVDNLEEIFPERKKHKSQVSKLKFDMIHAFILRSPEYFEDIKAIHHKFPFEIMIADITFGGIPFVKEKMNIPVISISVIPLPETSKDLAPSGLGITPSYSVIGKFKQKILRYIADKVLFAEPVKLMRKILASYGIDSGNANIFDILIQKSTLVLQSGTPGFEYRRTDMSSHIRFIGPLLPYTSKKQNNKWSHPKLAAYDKIILVTQGTVERDVQKLLIPSLEAFKNTECLVVVTTGGSQTEELRAKYPQNNIIIEDFIPFNDIMPYADVYISNGGYGGVLLSIQHQLPMIVAGVHEGKNEINARVGYFKLGINLRTEKPSVYQLRRSVEAILTTDEFSRNVSRLSREFIRYNPGELCAKYAARLLDQKNIEVQKNMQEEELIY